MKEKKYPLSLKKKQKNISLYYTANYKSTKKCWENVPLSPVWSAAFDGAHAECASPLAGKRLPVHAVSFHPSSHKPAETSIREAHHFYVVILVFLFDAFFLF